MMTKRQRLVVFLNVRTGEERLVGLLFAYSFLIGLASLMVQIAGNTLFLTTFGAQNIPYVYIGSIVILPLMAALYSILDRYSHLNRVFTLLLGLCWLVLMAIWAMLVFFPAAKWNLFPIARWTSQMAFIWYFVQDALIKLAFWGLAGQLLDVRQGKRLIGLISSGELLAYIAFGLTIPWLVLFIGLRNLLLIGSASILGLLVLTASLSRLAPLEVDRRPRTQSMTENTSILVRNWYGILMIVLAVLALVGFYFVDQIYQLQAELYFDGEIVLAGFLGAVETASAIAILLSRLFVTGPLLTRYGLVVGLVALSVVTILCITLMAFTNVVLVTGLAFLGLVAVSKLLVVALHKSTDHSAFQILYQSLTGDKKLRAQTIIDSIIQPGASGIAGLLLLTLSSVPLLIFYILVVILGLWIAVALFLGRKHKSTSAKALIQRAQVGPDIYLDASTLSIVERGLQSQNPGTVIYFLDVLDQANYISLEDILLHLCDHPSSQVRQNVLTRIEQRNLTEFMERVREFILPGPKQDTSLITRGYAVRTLAALGEADSTDETLPYLESRELPLKMGAMVGLLRNGGIEGVLLAGELLIEMAYSSDPAQRQAVANVLGAVNITNFYRPLIRLLQDKNTEVCRAALQAAGKLNNPRLWPLVINCLSIRGLSQASCLALIEGGHSALPFIHRDITNVDLPASVRINLIKACGRIGGEHAIAILLDNLDYPGTAIYYQTLKSLRTCNYHATGDDALRIEQLVYNEFSSAAWTLAGLEDLADEHPSRQSGDIHQVQAIELLITALEQKFERHLEQAVLLLTFMYDPHPLLSAWKTFQSPYCTYQERFAALGNIETLVSRPIAEILTQILDDIPIPEKLQRLARRYPQERLLPTHRLQVILTSPDIQHTSWLRLCVLWALSYIDPQVHRRYLDDTRYAPSSQIGEKLIPIPQPGDQIMLTLIEKVLLIKTIYIFSDTPDDVLAEMADLFEEDVFEKDEVILRKGEVGESLYVLIDGEVIIHNDERIFATRGSGEVIGEMSLLDGQPISASVTATQTTRMLRLDHHAFYELMADRIEIAQGIIRTLSLRLRALMELEIDEPKHEPSPKLEIATI